MAVVIYVIKLVFSFALYNNLLLSNANRAVSKQKGATTAVF